MGNEKEEYHYAAWSDEYKRIQERQHYNDTVISSLVTNSATIRNVLMLMVKADMLAHLVDVKGTFLHGEFEDGGIIHMKVQQGFEKHFHEGSVLVLKKCLYGLKQAANAFWRQLLRPQVLWDSSKARQIPAFITGGWKEDLS